MQSLIEIPIMEDVLTGWVDGTPRNFDKTLGKGNGNPWRLHGFKVALDCTPEGTSWTWELKTREMNRAATPSLASFNLRDETQTRRWSPNTTAGASAHDRHYPDGNAQEFVLLPANITLRMIVSINGGSGDITDPLEAYIAALVTQGAF